MRSLVQLSMSARLHIGDNSVSCTGFAGSGEDERLVMSPVSMQRCKPTRTILPVWVKLIKAAAQQRWREASIGMVTVNKYYV